MLGVVGYLRGGGGAKSATKVLLALCLWEGNRHVAVECGAIAEVLEAVSGYDVAAAERALAALELMCTTADGAEEVRSHALAVPVLVEMMRRMEGRGKESAISVLTVVFGGRLDEVDAPPKEVARAVAFALQGDCSDRGRRKGTQLLRVLQENGRLDLSQE